MVPVAALDAMSHEDAVGRQVPRGPPALSMEVWFSAAQEAGIAIMDQASSSTVAVQNHNKMEMEQRVFGTINTTVVEGGSDASEHGHVADPNLDAARDDRTFARAANLFDFVLLVQITFFTWAPRAARAALLAPDPIDHLDGAPQSFHWACQTSWARSGGICGWATSSWRVLLFAAVVQAGGDASLENPLSSLMWKVPWVVALAKALHLYEVDMGQCEYGAASMKATRFLASHALFKRWARSCRGDHAHAPLKGLVRDARGRKVFATKLAQVYPPRLCKAVFAVVKGNLPQNAESFQTFSCKVLMPFVNDQLATFDIGKNIDNIKQLAWPQQQAIS